MTCHSHLGASQTANCHLLLVRRQSGVRHLDPSFVIPTLRRGKSVENFLGHVPDSTVPSIRYVELRPVKDGVEVWVHDRDDCGGEDFTDLVEFPALGGEDPDRPSVVFEKPEEALAYSQTQLGAAPNRWTNVTVCHEDYADFVRAGRPAKWPVA